MIDEHTWSKFESLYATSPDDLLFWAVRHGNHHIVAKAIVHFGLDVNRRDISGRTALFWCLNLDTIKVLIDAGADIHIRDRYGKSAMAHTGHTRGIMLFLMERGARLADAIAIEPLSHFTTDYLSYDQALLEWVLCAQQCAAATLAFLCVAARRRSNLPRVLLRVLARYVWVTRRHHGWLKGVKVAKKR